MMNPSDYGSTEAGQVVRTRQGYWVFIPNPLPPALEWSPKIVTALSKADRALARLDTIGQNFPDPYLITKPFVRREAVLSSTIEGTQATLEDLYKYEAVQMTFLEKQSDAEEVYNYVRALDFGITRLEILPISLRLIKEVHEKLMTGIGPATPGEFRRSQNWIGPAGSTLENALFVPPPVSDMLDGLDKLEKFIHASTEIPALVRIGLIHYQFEAIHPFLDGNGRVGRILIALLMQAWKLLSEPILNLSAYFEPNRQAYYDSLLTVSKTGAWEEWLMYFLEGVRRQSVEAAERIERLQTLREELGKRVQNERNSAGLIAVIDFLIGHPIASIRQVQAGIGVEGYKTAQRRVLKLEKLGILREITGRARFRLYQADEILEVIQGEVSGDG